MEKTYLRSFPSPTTDFKNKALSQFFSYLDRWKDIKGIQFFRKYYNGVKKKSWFHSFDSLPRFVITSVSRIKCNHYNLNASFARCNIINSPCCKCGFYSKNINYVLWNCPLYSNQRKDYLLLKNNWFQPPVSHSQHF